MSWSYYVPARDDKDLIRMLVGDRLSADPLLEDDEIYTFLILEGNDTPRLQTSSRRLLFRAAAECARAIAGNYARKVDAKTASDQQQWLSQRYKHFMDLYQQLRARAARAGIAPRYGGLSVAGKLSARSDTDLVQPAFRRTDETEPGTGPNEPLTGEMEGLEFAP